MRPAYSIPSKHNAGRGRNDMSKKCSVEGCERKHLSNGFCRLHYDRWKNNGSPNKVQFYKDGHKKDNLAMYRIWSGMKTRCYNKKCKSYKHYGGRGIKVCDRWLGIDGFANFLDDMGKRPTDKHSLDRVDPNGPYSPENCRWATWKQQENNRRINKYYEYDGKKMTLPQWSRELGISLKTLHYRKYIKKLSVPKLLAPIDTRYSRQK